MAETCTGAAAACPADEVAAGGTVCRVAAGACDVTEQCTGADPLCPTDDVLDGVPCPDGDVCNGSETCVVGSCTPGTALDCDDGDACTADGCDALGGCFNDPIPGCGTAVPVATDLGRGLLVLAFAVVGLAALNVAARRRTTAG